MHINSQPCLPDLPLIHFFFPTITDQPRSRQGQLSLPGPLQAYLWLDEMRIRMHRRIYALPADLADQPHRVQMR